ncbi:hypothetical protein EUX98_g8888 [Antrodiella citrinella]|uniref:Ribonuclease H1 N-terminal domain-containing protein n=1 Tax=Antrodiella citrinella TaxID=2447956 RepID=A0A4S4M391_9APHY|nr:hypothetical protein EUX98_g8888 [Antrodiella citrinella]
MVNTFSRPLRDPPADPSRDQEERNGGVLYPTTVFAQQSRSPQVNVTAEFHGTFTIAVEGNTIGQSRLPEPRPPPPPIPYSTRPIQGSVHVTASVATSEATSGGSNQEQDAFYRYHDPTPAPIAPAAHARPHRQYVAPPIGIVGGDTRASQSPRTGRRENPQSNVNSGKCPDDASVSEYDSDDNITKSHKWYVIFIGKEIGIFKAWENCLAYTVDKRARWCKKDSRREAEDAYRRAKERGHVRKLR